MKYLNEITYMSEQYRLFCLIVILIFASFLFLINSNFICDLYYMFKEHRYDKKYKKSIETNNNYLREKYTDLLNSYDSVYKEKNIVDTSYKLLVADIEHKIKMNDFKEAEKLLNELKTKIINL